jgi:hypothetical protein
MAIRLSLDLEDATCADLLRFTDTVRAAGTPPNQPIERAGPDRIEVSLERPPAGADGHEPGFGAEGWLAGGPPPPDYVTPPAPDPYSDPFGPTPGPRPVRPMGPTGPPGYPGDPGRGTDPGSPPGRPPMGRPTSGPVPRPGGPMPRPGGPDAWYGTSQPYSGMPFPGGPVSGVPGHVTSHFGTSHFGPSYPYATPMPAGPPAQGAFISVRTEGASHATQVSPETVERWRVALSEALEQGGLSEATRAPLLELREMLSVDRGFRAGSGS